jgi:hypothetical protein
MEPGVPDLRKQKEPQVLVREHLWLLYRPHEGQPRAPVYMRHSVHEGVVGGYSLHKSTSAGYHPLHTQILFLQPHH